MALKEDELKKRLQTGVGGLYVLYGEESYLTAHYADLIAQKTVADGFDAFNMQQFDGQEITPEQLAEAVEALPMMAERKYVGVRDMNVGSVWNEQFEAMITDLPDSCVLVFRQISVQPDRFKGWNAFLKTAEKCGTVVRFDRKTPADLAKMLVSGAKKRGCTMDAAVARYMVEQAGTDLSLLLNELEKLTALADGGTVTRELVDAAGVKNLEAKVFDLSKRIFAKKREDALLLLHQLLANREEPLAILGALSTAFADVYRVKAARAAGERARSIAECYESYKGKEFRLDNAVRDASRLSTETLRDALAVLAATDTAMKSGRGDSAVLLEQTVVELTERIR